QRRQLSESGTHRNRQAVQKSAVRGEDLLERLHQGSVRRAAGTRRDRDDLPAVLGGDRTDLTAERGLADAGLAADRDQAGSASGGRGERSLDRRELDLPAEQDRALRPEVADTAVVERAALGVRAQAQLARERVPQPPVPADRGVP